VTGPGNARLQRAWDENRGWIAILFVLCVVIYFMLAFADQAWRARALQGEVDRQRAAIESIERENAMLQERVVVYQSGAYIDYVEARARRDLNLAHPDETVLMIRWGPRAEVAETAATTVDAPAPEPNWKRWVDAFVGD
jgi:cell division protein FtsB